MNVRIFTSGDYICRKGEVAREMFVTVISGKIVVVARTADKRTVGYVECFVLSKDDVLNATRDYPEAQAVLAEYGRRRLECQTTCKNPRLVDMEDCHTNTKTEGTEHRDNNNIVSTENKTMEERTELRKNSSEVTVNSSNPLASSSSYSSYSSSIQSGLSTHFLQAHNGVCVGSSSQDTLASPLNFLVTRRSSRGGLLDPIPSQPSTPNEKLSPFVQTSLNNVNSISKSTRDLGQAHSLDAVVNPGERDAILRMMTSSLGKVVNYVKNETRKQMEVEMNEMQSQLRTLKDEVYKKIAIIDHMTELLSTQEAELEAWREVVNNLQSKRAESNQQVQEPQKEIEALKLQVSACLTLKQD